jgi:hypothetical protein
MYVKEFSLRKAVLFLVVLQAIGCLGSSAQIRTSAKAWTSGEAYQIRPGTAVGPLRLGDGRERAEELLGQPILSADLRDSKLSTCDSRVLIWADTRAEGGGITAYARDTGIYQIWVSDFSSYTEVGVKRGSAATVVRANYLDLESFVLRNSDPGYKGGKVQNDAVRDLVYWVSRLRGIAFELYYDQEAHRRLVRKIIVFSPGTDFVPMDCVSALIPQQWERMEVVAEEPVPESSTVNERVP